MNLENLIHARAGATVIWIVRECSALIDDIDTLLDPFLDTFRDEQPGAHLVIVHFLVKAYCAKPEVR
jgi:hypothetical protein